MSSFELGCCPGFIWTLVTPLFQGSTILRLWNPRSNGAAQFREKLDRDDWLYMTTAQSHPLEISVATGQEDRVSAAYRCIADWREMSAFFFPSLIQVGYGRKRGNCLPTLSTPALPSLH